MDKLLQKLKVKWSSETTLIKALQSATCVGFSSWTKCTGSNGWYFGLFGPCIKLELNVEEMEMNEMEIQVDSKKYLIQNIENWEFFRARYLDANMVLLQLVNDLSEFVSIYKDELDTNGRIKAPSWMK